MVYRVFGPMSTISVKKQFVSQKTWPHSAKEIWAWLFTKMLINPKWFDTVMKLYTDTLPATSSLKANLTHTGAIELQI